MKAIQISLILTLLFIVSCQREVKSTLEVQTSKPMQYITVLGTAQDAGYPQINCSNDCCKAFYTGEETKKLVSCLGLIDSKNQKKYLFDATPDIIQQSEDLKQNHLDNGSIIDGVFLTHAHIGHYTGIMFLGRESMGANKVPTYVMPKMKSYLEENGPWSQLVTLENIELKKMQHDSIVNLTSELKVTPFLVPHRDEFSETVGFKIEGENKSALFIPDINKWQLWERDIVEEVKKVDYAFLDATFFKDGEIPRPMSEVPHPFIEETVKLFEQQTKATRSKVYFIHFNHSNPALKDKHVLKDSIQALGYNFAKRGAIFGL